MESLAYPHSDAGRKALGAYYTPGWLADILADWAVYSDNVSVLDPSFGGCAFLESALRVLKRRDVHDAPSRIFGVDVDPRAWDFAENLLSAGVPPHQLLRGNFLDGKVVAAVPAVGSLVGNPPYVRHHALDDGTIEKAQRSVRELGVALPRMASAWAYFTVLAVSRVAEGGRLALILPGAVLQVDYADGVVAHLRRSFKRTRLIHVHERLFEGTQEESVILLAEERIESGAGEVTYLRVHSRDSVKRAVAEHGVTTEGKDYKLHLLPEPVREAWAVALERVPHVLLGDESSIRIGVVTGANDFFIRSAGDVLLGTKDVNAVPIVTRNRWLSRPVITRSALERLTRAGERTRLAVIHGCGRARSRLRRELANAERCGIAARYHCRNRSPWYLVHDSARPDIFLGYMNAEAPALVRNDARATCTNAIHRINVKDKAMRDVLVSGSHSAIFRFACELFGRHYGGGVLKLEPSEAAALPIPIAVPSVGAIAELSSRAERHIAVDNEILQRCGLGPGVIPLLREGIELLSRHRRRLL